MNFVRRLFGWPTDEAAQEASQDGIDQQKQRRERRARQPHQQSAAEASAPPVLVARPAGDGGIQGLDWFKGSLLQDSEGDCAHTFLEEQRHEQEQQQAKRQRNRASEARRRQQQEAAAAGQPPPQQPGQQQSAAMQCCSRRAQLVGPSDMMLDRGNVFVVPHSEDS